MLIKVAEVTVIPGVGYVPPTPGSVTCATSAPAPTDPDAPTVTNPEDTTYGGVGYYVYVPSDPNVYVSETRTYSLTPPSGSYTCTQGTYLVPDSNFLNGLKPVQETRCFWNYP